MTNFSSVDFKGMDPGQVESFARQLDTASKNLDQTRFSLAGIIDDFARVAFGPLVDMLFGDSSRIARQEMQQISRDLKELGLLAMRNVVEQDRASAGGLRSLSASGGYVPGGIQGEPRNGLKGTTNDMMDLAEAAYDKNSPAPEGWRALNDGELKRMGIDPSELKDDDSGFKANVYISKDGRIVLAFAGTDGMNPFSAESRKDVGTDIIGAFGETRQDKLAIDLAKRVRDSAAAEGMAFAVVGHSLGGRLATAASMATKAPCLTVNPAGIHNATKEDAYFESGGQSDTRQIVNIKNQQCLLTNFQESPFFNSVVPQTEGQDIYVPGKRVFPPVLPGTAVGVGVEVWNGVENHGIDRTQESYNED